MAQGVDAHLLVLKSPLGRQALRERTHGLEVLERRILILADGRLRLGEIAVELDRGVDDPELAAAAQRLLDGQFLLVRDDYDERRGGTRGRRRPWLVGRHRRGPG